MAVIMLDRLHLRFTCRLMTCMSNHAHPNLNSDGILVVAQKTLQREVLFKAFEQGLYLPTTTIDLTQYARWSIEIIGYECDSTFVLVVLPFRDSTTLVLSGFAFSYPDNAILRASSPSVTQLLPSHWAFGAFSPREFYNFVADDDICILLWNIPGLDNCLFASLLLTSNIKDTIVGKQLPCLIVYVAHVERDTRATGKFGAQSIQQSLVTCCRIGYVHECHDIFVCLYHRMSFDTTLLLPIYGIASSSPKYLGEKGYGGTVHDK